MRSRREVIRASDYQVHVLGGPTPGLRDVYHALLRMPWWTMLLVIVGGWLLLNLLFALGFFASGGVANAEPGSLADHFFFSVQTMGTVGYGSMYPASRAANALVVAESVVGLLVTALATGLVFVRFSLTRARVVFCSRVAVAPMDGVPTLMIRMGNERSGALVDATFRATLMKTTRTAEGVMVYRAFEVALTRDRTNSLGRSWMVFHEINPGSPFHEESPESLAKKEAELTLIVTGTDDTSLQPVHARFTWMHRDLVFGARLADIVSEMDDGNLVIDLTRFHDLAPSEPTESFPYPAREGES